VNTSARKAFRADTTNPMLNAALSYAQRGWLVFPLIKGEKVPSTQHGYHDATALEAQIVEWWTAKPMANVGIAAGEKSDLLVLDIDNKANRKGSASLEKLVKRLGSLPLTYTVNTPNNGVHYYFSYPLELKYTPLKRELAEGVDLKVNGYVVAPPSGLKDSGTYSLSIDSDISPLPESWIAECVKDELGSEEWERLEQQGAGGSICETHDITMRDVIAIPQTAKQTREGYLIKHPVHGATGNGNLSVSTRRNLWYCFRCGSGGDPLTWIAVREGFIECNAAGAGCLDKATFKRCLDVLKSEGLILEPTAKVTVPTQDGLEHFTVTLGKHLSDLGNAKRFVERYHHKVRYCEEMRSWFIYDGLRWAQDKTRLIMQFACNIPSVVDAEVSLIEGLRDIDNKKKESLKDEYRRWARTSQFRNRLEAMLELAKTFPDIAIRAEQWDEDPCLFNVRNGTLNLRTGENRSHDPKDYITKYKPIDYDPHAKDERWGAFLKRVQPSPMQRDFLQRASGYSLTGFTSQEAAFFAYGPPASGKSTFLEALLKMTGTYGIASNFSAFLTRRTSAGGPREDIARMMGARLIVCNEVNKNTTWNAAFVKSLTSGDRTTARIPYAMHSVEFEPKFKLWFGANYRPKCDFDDDAVFRRFYTTPFDVVIPENERDRTLKDYFKNNESAQQAILAWAVQGAVKWFEASVTGSDGLQAPREVVAAAREYKCSMSPVWEFISNDCVVGSDPAEFDDRTQKRRPYEEGIDELWYEFSDNSNHYDTANVKSKKSLGKHLSGLGFESYRNSKDKSYYRKGLRLVKERENAEILRLVSDEEVFPQTMARGALQKLLNDLVYPITQNEHTQEALNQLQHNCNVWLFGCLDTLKSATLDKKSDELEVYVY
jgi:putative DNA primase/helicase